MKQKYRAVKDYQIIKDYDIDKLINFTDNICLRAAGKNSTLGLECRNQINQILLDGSDNFDDFKKNTVLLGIRTTLENELKVSDIEALNYLMGFPLNFELKSFVKMLSDDMGINENITNIEKIKYLIKLKTETTELGHIARLKLDFDKKEKLIEQNFKNPTHIDVQEFLAWAESKGFIKNKSAKFRTIPISGF